MVYSAQNAPNQPMSGSVGYRNPAIQQGCGCGARKEGFRAEAPAAPVSSCTLTAAAPPAQCCNPAPLHCEGGCASYFLAAEAYGS